MKNLLKISFIGAFVTVFMIMFLLISEQSVMAAEDNFKVKTSYGYSGEARYGRYIPVKFTFTDVKKDFNGSIALYIGAAEATKIEKNFVVGKGEEKTISIPVLASKASVSMEYDIANSKGKKVKSGKFTFSSKYNDSKVYIGMLTDDYNSLNYMSHLIFSYNQSMTTSIFKLTEEDIPEEYFTLGTFDLIVINNYNLENLSQKQIDALVQWVDNGGSLLIGTGENGKKSLSRMSVISDKFSLDSFGSKVVSITDRNSFSLGSFSITGSETESLMGSDADSVLSMTNYGDGVAAIAGFDLGTTDFISGIELENQAFSKIMFKIITEETFNNISNGMYGSSEDYWQIQNMLQGFINGKFPNLFVFSGIIILYIAGVIPVVFLILKKKEKSKFAYPILAGCSLITCIIIYIAGSASRFSEPYLNYARIIDISGMGATEKTYLSMQSPDNSSYTVNISDRYSISPLSFNDYWFEDDIKTDPRDYTTGLKMTTEGTGLTVRNAASFEERYFTLTSGVTKDSIPEVECNLLVFDGEVSGTVVNNSDNKLEDAFAILGSVYVDLGNIEPGETKEIDKSWSSGFNVNTWDLGEKIVKEKDVAVAKRRAQYINSYMETNVYYTNIKINKLIFFTDKESIEPVQSDGKYECKGITMYVQQADINNEVNGVKYYSELDGYSDNLDMNVNIDENTNSVYFQDLSMSNSFTYNYNITGLNLTDITVKTDFDSFSKNNFEGNVFIYDFVSGNDIDITDQVGKPIDMSTLSNYIWSDQAGNEYLTLKYEYSGTGYGDNFAEVVLPEVSGKGSAQ